MNDKTNKKLSVKVKTYSRSRYTYPRNRQGGALLLGLIITMVIFGLLGGAMVYVLSSSSMDTVFGNFAQRAYYAAESGMRYAVATYRKAYDDPAGKTNFQALVGAERTLTFPNGSAKLTITQTTTTDVDTVVATTDPLTTQIDLGGNLTIDPPSVGAFPLKNGFFRRAGDTNYYRYKTRLDSNGIATNVLQGITGPGTWPKTGISHATNITSPGSQYNIKSVGLSGLFRRTVEYGWILSGIPPGGPIGDSKQLQPNDVIMNNPAITTGTALGQFALTDVGVAPAITVTDATGGAAEAVYGYLANPNPFYDAWYYAGRYLSYDIQIKIATGDWNGSSFEKSSVASNGYIAGLTFRSKGTNPAKWEQLGLDFANFHSTSDGAFPSGLRIYPDLLNKTTYTRDQIRWNTKNPIGFFQCDADTCDYDSWTLVNNWIPYDPPPMILLWIRVGNATSALDYWMAYMQLKNNPITSKNEPDSGIVDSSGLLKDWSTITLRVVEAASIKLTTTTTSVVVGDTITADTATTVGGFKAKVIKIINDKDTDGGDGKIVLLLNSVVPNVPLPTPTGTFSLPTDSSWGYRPRDNYIWAMFGDTSSHPDGTLGDDKMDGNNVAINDIRRANARILDTTDNPIVNASNVNCYIHWPETNIANWGNDIVENCPSPETGVKNDYFKLVRWDTLNPDRDNGTWAVNVDMRIMGTGKEAGAILRTSHWTTDSANYTSTPFPYEIGFHSIGTTAERTYFDDLAFNFPEQSKPGGIDYVPPVQN